jgi:hypothetical protein
VTLVMTLLVRDEMDIVQANLEFHLAQGVDFVVATDNGSVDGTLDLLRQYEQAGVLRVIQEPVGGYYQSEWVTRMARLAATDHGADWVINNDADELWWPVTGDLASTLAAVPAGTDVVQAQRWNFVTRPDDERSFAERMTVRHATSVNPEEGRPLQPKACHRGHPEVSVLQGNHDVDWPGRGATVADGHIEILHFPVRSYDQLERKILNGGVAYERSDLPEGLGLRWRHLLGRHRAGEFDEAFARFVWDDAAVAAGLASGELVEDTRARDLLRSRSGRGGFELR